MAFAAFGTFRAADGAHDGLVAHLLRAAELLASDAACRQYIVGTPSDDEVSVFEVWSDESAHAASLEREDVRALIAEARPLIAGFGGQTRLTVHGGKGL
ncbi:MAG: putative quinol monooxygenase [Acidimicrobiia bacterium]